MTFRLTLCATAFICAAGLAQAEAFFCPGYGDVDVRVTFIEGTDAAIAEFIAGADNPSAGADPVTLRARRGANGIAYEGGDFVLSGAGDAAELTSGDLTVACTRDGSAAAPCNIS